MTNKQISAKLLAIWQSLEDGFAAAQKSTDPRLGMAKVIGAAQGNVKILAIDIGVTDAQLNALRPVLYGKEGA
jgi:hypothetical protein